MTTRLRTLVLFSLALIPLACGGGGGGGAPGASIQAELVELTVAGATLSPTFSSKQLTYTGAVPHATNSVTVTAATADSKSQLVIDGVVTPSRVASAPILLDVGETVIPILVSGADGTTNTYLVAVKRPASPATATLSGIGLSAGTLSPAFDADTTAYSVDVGFLIRTLAITPSTDLAGASITIDGAPATSGQPTTKTLASQSTNVITLRVTADTATRDYVLTVAREPVTQFAQEAYLKANNAQANDRFGRSIAFSGDTLVVGADFEDSNATGIGGNQFNNQAVNSGAVYVFTRTGSTWSQQAYIKASNTDASDFFGFSVALDGDTLVVGAFGEDSSALGIGGNQASNTQADSGAAYVFTRTGGVWSQQSYLKASNAQGGDFFGQSVAIAGDTIVVGATGEDGILGDPTSNTVLSSGAAYVFVRTGPTWSQQAYLKAAVTDQDDRFGLPVAIAGDTIVVGALGEDSGSSFINQGATSDSAPDAGAAYVFVRSGSTWSQQAYLKSFNIDAGDQFGRSLAIEGDTVVVGAPGEDSFDIGGPASSSSGSPFDNSASSSGAAYVFTRSGTTWSPQRYLKAGDVGDPVGVESQSLFGTSVAISNGMIAVGAPDESGNATGINGGDASAGTTQSGAVYLFVLSGTSWFKQAYVKASNTGVSDGFGAAIVLAGDTLLSAATFESSDATGVNGDQGNDNAPFSGAVYVLR